MTAISFSIYLLIDIEGVLWPHYCGWCWDEHRLVGFSSAVDFVSFVYTHKWHFQVTQSSSLTFWGNTLLFSIMFVPPYFYQVQGLLPSQSCPRCCLSANSYSSRYGVLSHCAFTFLMIDGVEHLFTHLLPIFTSYYMEKYVYAFCPFFKKMLALCYWVILDINPFQINSLGIFSPAVQGFLFALCIYSFAAQVSYVNPLACFHCCCLYIAVLCSLRNTPRNLAKARLGLSRCCLTHRIKTDWKIVPP